MLAHAGFDIAHPFDPAITADDPALAHIAGFGNRRALLIGNTRALWSPFVAARAADADLDRDPHPLDRYTEQTIAREFAGAPMWFAHVRYGGAFLPFQRLAVLTGFAARAPTQLVIHPVYGPWFALRAVVVSEGNPPSWSPELPSYRCSGSCEAVFRSACESTDWRDWLAVRDACAVGREFRYSDDQIAYHYSNAAAALRRSSPPS